MMKHKSSILAVTALTAASLPAMALMNEKSIDKSQENSPSAESVNSLTEESFRHEHNLKIDTLEAQKDFKIDSVKDIKLAEEKTIERRDLTPFAKNDSDKSACKLASSEITQKVKDESDDASVGGVIGGTAGGAIGGYLGGPLGGGAGLIVGYKIGDQSEQELINLRINTGSDWVKGRKKIAAFIKNKGDSIQRKSKDLARALERKVKDLGNRYGL